MYMCVTPYKDNNPLKLDNTSCKIVLHDVLTWADGKTYVIWYFSFQELN